ncbi:hypothetical protein ACFQ15_00230 [Sphingomonas hankookensis]|nr:hypothetical protein [Sphingomonas hankookensis]
MRPRLRIIAAAFGAALLAFTFALPFLKGKRCLDAGGQFDRTTLACSMPR